MNDESIYVVNRLLDQQIVDSEGRRCGRVDDVELRGDPPRISALLIGDGLYPRRLSRRLRGPARRLVGPEIWGANAVRVPWEEVEEIEPAVKLRGKAEELGLGQGDDPKRWMVSRLPWN
jgi:sporulation protein YlmC with PRC-barrel domain